MTDVQVIEIAVQAMLLAVKLGAPMLLTILAIGLIVGLFQSVTQLQEPTLTFVPKFAGAGVVLLVSGNWMLTELVNFTNGMFELIPTLISGG